MERHEQAALRVENWLNQEGQRETTLTADLRVLVEHCKPRCDHDNSRPTNQFVGTCVIYRCNECGEEWEKDVS